jgi:uncharacterized protein (DUF2225 family)
MTIWRRDIRVCPVCENRFAVEAVDACGSHGADSDFRPHYWGSDPLEHFVHACRECGFAGTETDFREGVTEPVIRRIRKFLTPRTRDLSRSSAAFFRYEFLALIYEWEDRSSLEVGDAFLRAAWVARARENREKERLYQREAVRRFEEALEVGECRDQEQRAVIAYLVGDLHRRLNRRRRAETWFHRAREEFELVGGTDTELGWLGNQIRRQIEMPSDILD